MFEVPPGASLRALWAARRPGVACPSRSRLNASDAVPAKTRVLIRVCPDGWGLPIYYVTPIGRVTRQR